VVASKIGNALPGCNVRLIFVFVGLYLLDINSKFRVVAMLVIIHLQYAYACVCASPCHILLGSSVIIVRLTTKDHLDNGVMFVHCTLQNITNIICTYLRTEVTSVSVPAMLQIQSS
jgi:hypothetical protein